MSVFYYKALTHAGKEMSGHIEATNSQMALSQLKKQNLYIKELREDIAGRDRELFPFLSKIIYHVPRKDIGLFARQLATLLGAGIKLDNALGDIQEQTRNQHLSKSITSLKAAVTEGKSLSEAIGAQEHLFPPIYKQMIRVGEATGSYEKTLTRLAELEEKGSELKNKVITAMIYPVIMIMLSLFVVLFLLNSVVPQIQEIFESFKAELPLPTKIVIFFSMITRRLWPLFIISIFGLYYALHVFKKKEGGQLKLDKFKLKIPLYGNLIRKLEVSRFSRNLGILLESGVPLLDSLTVVQTIVDNQIFKAELLEAARQIKEGESLVASFKSSTFLPHMVKGMISAGESSDRLAELILKTADIMENEVDTSVKGLTTALEPLMMIVMGGLVGGIMVAILMPLYQMSQLIK